MRIGGDHIFKIIIWGEKSLTFLETTRMRNFHSFANLSQDENTIPVIHGNVTTIPLELFHYLLL